MYCVYKHTAPNGKVYIGMTGRNPIRRWGAGNNYLKQRHFGSAIKKYGWNNFKHEIICKDLTKEEACKLEKKLIAEYRSNEPKFGYNLSSGGECGAAGVVPSLETRRKWSEQRKGRGLGRHLSEETKKKLSAWNKGRYAGEKHPFYGKHWTPEQRKKLSVAHIGKQTGKDNPKARKVLNIDKNEVFDTLTAAANSVSRVPSGLLYSIKKGTRCGGYRWAYYDEKE